MYSEEESLQSVYNSFSSESDYRIKCPACSSRMISDDKQKRVPAVKGSNVKDKIKYFSGTPSFGTPSSSDNSFDSFKDCKTERNISLNLPAPVTTFYKSRTEIFNTKNGI